MCVALYRSVVINRACQMENGMPVRSRHSLGYWWGYFVLLLVFLGGGWRKQRWTHMMDFMTFLGPCSQQTDKNTPDFHWKKIVLIDLPVLRGGSKALPTLCIKPFATNEWAMKCQSVWKTTISKKKAGEDKPLIKLEKSHLLLKRSVNASCWRTCWN